MDLPNCPAFEGMKMFNETYFKCSRATPAALPSFFSCRVATLGQFYCICFSSILVLQLGRKGSIMRYSAREQVASELPPWTNFGEGVEQCNKSKNLPLFLMSFVATSSTSFMSCGMDWRTGQKNKMTSWPFKFDVSVWKRCYKMSWKSDREAPGLAPIASSWLIFERRHTRQDSGSRFVHALATCEPRKYACRSCQFSVTWNVGVRQIMGIQWDISS